MFLSFKLEEAETRYSTTEREALAVVRCLAEVKSYVMGHKFPTMIYTDHKALESILVVGTDAQGRVARAPLMNRLVVTLKMRTLAMLKRKRTPSSRGPYTSV